MYNKILVVLAVLIGVTILVLNAYSNSNETVFYMSPDHCCSVELTKIDDDLTRLRYRDYTSMYDHTDWDYTEEYPTHMISERLANIDSWCQEHHHPIPR